MRLNFILLLVLFQFLSFNLSFAQNGSDELNGCERYLPVPYISDGQHYMSLLSGNDAAEFTVLFYENTEYRITACSSTPKVELVYNLYDQERNLLFSSQDQENNPFWNFKFESTMECYIEARIKAGSPESGMALVMIGFKKNE